MRRLIFCCSSDDHSRVKLKEIAGEKGSNYINACFVNVSAKCLRYAVLFGRCFHVLFFLHRATIVRTRTLRLKVCVHNTGVPMSTLKELAIYVPLCYVHLPILTSPNYYTLIISDSSQSRILHVIPPLLSLPLHPFLFIQGPCLTLSVTSGG